MQKESPVTKLNDRQEAFPPMKSPHKSNSAITYIDIYMNLSVNDLMLGQAPVITRLYIH